MRSSPEHAPIFALGSLRSRCARVLRGRVTWLIVGFIVIAGLLVIAPHRAQALEAIALKPDLERIEISSKARFIDGRGDNIQVQTAAGADGVKGLMAVRAATPGTNPNWLVFALTNPTNQPIERWLTVERYTLIGSGIVWPDLDAKRIEAVTPSIGFLPERVKSDRADIFRISVEPGQTITYAVELASDRYPKANLWAPLVYELRARDRQLFNGIMLGITGVLGIFLTAVFAANHKAIFPCAALVTWCVLAYLCVDFGFWHKLLQLRAEDNAVYRAATESAMAASFVIFLHVFLRLGAWIGFIRMLFAVWIIAQMSLIAIAVIDPRLASTFARASFAAIAGLGILLILFLTFRRQDRALSLLPTWIIFMVWVFAAAMTLTGQLSGPIVVSSLVAGLVLVVVLVGFAVTQFAFRSIDTIDAIAPTEQQLRSLAIEGAGAAVWEWNARRQEIKVSPIVEMSLGLAPGVLSTKVDDFLMYLHEADRERFRLMLWSAQESGGSELLLKFRMRHADSTYRWFDLEAAAMKASDRRSLRCVGLLRDITEAKRSQERLMHDAVHDSLTGLPNRELFLDRVSQSLIKSNSSGQFGQTILFIDIDKFKSANSSFGLTVGDSLLLTVAKRLDKHLGPHDTLGRVAGDQFAILFVDAEDATALAMRAERIRRSLRAPIRITGQDIVLTASIGIATNDGSIEDGVDFLRDAEIAMYRAKRSGTDKVEVFSPEFRNEVDDRLAIESDLRKALSRREIQVLYQPIIYLATEELAGFEALVRWQHPQLGLLNPMDFVPVAEQSDLIVRLGSYVLSCAVRDAAIWHKELPRSDRQLFVSVNVSTRQLLRPELIQEVRQIVGRQLIPPSALKLEITESLVMENPEQATEALEILKATGIGISIDDFGTGYSSLSYLQRFPVDTLKIDRDLVQASTEGAGSAIVRSIVALSHELGKKVVAEGVELAADVGFLRSIGCEYAQGFYYGGAMSMNEVLKFLRLISKSERKLQRRGLFTVSSKKTRRSSPAATRKQSDKAAGMKGGEGHAARPAGSKQIGATGLMRTRPRNPSDTPIQQPRGAMPPPTPQSQTASTVRPTPATPPPSPPPLAQNPRPDQQAPITAQSKPPPQPPDIPPTVPPPPSQPKPRSNPFSATAKAVGSLTNALAKFGDASASPSTSASGRNGRDTGPPMPPAGMEPEAPTQSPDVVSGLGRALGAGDGSNQREGHVSARPKTEPTDRAGTKGSQTAATPAENGHTASTPVAEKRASTTLPPALARSLEKLAGDKS